MIFAKHNIHNPFLCVIPGGSIEDKRLPFVAPLILIPSKKMYKIVLLQIEQ